MQDQSAWDWAQQRLGILEGRIADANRRIADLERMRDKQAFDAHAVKGVAAQQQAPEHLYAPLRSDTKPLLEMAAFVRKVATVNVSHLDGADTLYALIDEAIEILKRST
jgi:hypothetical protein